MNFSAVKLKDYLLCKSNDSDEMFRKKNEQILQQIYDLSDNDSEHSFSDLINDYTNNKKPNASETFDYCGGNCSKDSIESEFKHESNQLNDTKEREVNFLENHTDDSSDLIIPEKDVIRWAAQIVLALEKLHNLGVICR